MCLLRFLPFPETWLQAGPGPLALGRWSSPVLHVLVETVKFMLHALAVLDLVRQTERCDLDELSRLPDAPPTLRELVEFWESFIERSTLSAMRSDMNAANEEIVQTNCSGRAIFGAIPVGLYVADLKVVFDDEP